MNAVRVDRTLAQQAEMIVDVEIAATPRKQLGDPAYFVQVLGQMRLHEHAGILLEQLPGKLELTLR